MAARSMSVLKAIGRFDPFVVQEGRFVVRVLVASSSAFRSSAVDCKPSQDLHRRLYCSQEGSDTFLRTTVKHGVQNGLRNALNNLKFDLSSGSAARLAIVKEAVDAGVIDALKEANLYSDHVPVISEEQKFITLAVKEGFCQAIEEIEQRKRCQDPLQKTEFDTAVIGLKRDLELQTKTALQELKDGSDDKFLSAMDSLTERLNVFMETYKDMFAVDEEGCDDEETNSTKEGYSADGTNSTKEGDFSDGTYSTKEGAKSGPESKKEVDADETNSTKEAAKADGTESKKEVDADETNSTKEGANADKTNSKKRPKTKFDVFVEKYNKDSLETHRVLNRLLGKQADIVDDWYKGMAEKVLDKTWMQRFRVVKAVVPHMAKIYFLYAFVQMMRQSKVPVWKYPAAFRAGRLLMSKKVLEVLEEAEKNGQKPEEGKLWSKVWEVFKMGGNTPGDGGNTPGEGEQDSGGDESNDD